jgi:hypothetical protein
VDNIPVRSPAAAIRSSFTPSTMGDTDRRFEPLRNHSGTVESTRGGRGGPPRVLRGAPFLRAAIDVGKRGGQSRPPVHGESQVRIYADRAAPECAESEQRQEGHASDEQCEVPSLLSTLLCNTEGQHIFS